MCNIFHHQGRFVKDIVTTFVTWFQHFSSQHYCSPEIDRVIANGWPCTEGTYANSVDLHGVRCATLRSDTNRIRVMIHRLQRPFFFLIYQILTSGNYAIIPPCCLELRYHSSESLVSCRTSTRVETGSKMVLGCHTSLEIHPRCTWK